MHTWVGISHRIRQHWSDKHVPLGYFLGPSWTISVVIEFCWGLLLIINGEWIIYSMKFVSYACSTYKLLLLRIIIYQSF